MKRQRIGLLAVSLTLAAVGVDAWTWSRLTSARDRAGGASADMVQCRRLADDILRLHDRPAVAGSRQIELTELSRRIERAAADSGIPAGDVIRISPEAARRPDGPAGETGVGDSPRSDVDGVADRYLEEPTTVLLTGVTLRQLVSFLHAVGTGPDAMDARSLRLSAPRDQEDSDRWEAEVTVSYLIYTLPPSSGDEPGGTSVGVLPSQGLPPTTGVRGQPR